MSSTKILTLVGRAGRDPEIKAGDWGSFVGFSLAVNATLPDREAGEESGEVIWYDVTVNNQGLGQSVMRDVYKGATVAVEGIPGERQYDGKTYPKLAAYMVGTVERLAR